MHVQILSSGSEGNATLVRAGDTTLLVDAGLASRDLDARLGAAGVPWRGIDHVLLSHGHLDHARSAGLVAKRHWATLHCAERYMGHRWARRAKRFSTLSPGAEHALDGPRGPDGVRVKAVAIPHDCDPTVAFRIAHGDRVAAIVTDMGAPRREVARALGGAHLVVLEFNWDPELMARGPYPEPLRQRITGGRGHLSNAQAAQMLAWLAGPELHTLVLAHLSRKTNAPERALAAAHGALAALGRTDVRVLVAEQDAVGPNLAV